MLSWIGFDNVPILDGGMNAWKSAGYELSSESPTIQEAMLTVATRPHLIADRDEVMSAIENDSVLLIDAMPPEHYRGEMVMYGRAGHIPTAVNMPNVFAEDGKFLSDTVLEEMHKFDRDKRFITYCGGGISASANAFAMHNLGFSDVAVYTNSLDEWAANPENPMTVSD